MDRQLPAGRLLVSVGLLTRLGAGRGAGPTTSTAGATCRFGTGAARRATDDFRNAGTPSQWRRARRRRCRRCRQLALPSTIGALRLLGTRITDRPSGQGDLGERGFGTRSLALPPGQDLPTWPTTSRRPDATSVGIGRAAGPLPQGSRPTPRQAPASRGRSWSATDVDDGYRSGGIRPTDPGILQFSPNLRGVFAPGSPAPNRVAAETPGPVLSRSRATSLLSSAGAWCAPGSRIHPPATDVGHLFTDRQLGGVKPAEEVPARPDPNHQK